MHPLYLRAFSAILALACAHAMAQSTTNEVVPLDEIVVAGSLTQKTLDEIPTSIAVIGRDAIERSTATHFEQLGLQVANLNFAGGSNRARYFQIRGIGERSQYEGAPNPSVGFIIDDVDFSAIGGVSSTWDLERVEVLRGPQATRYGANALAGLVYLESVAPSDVFESRVRLQTGNDGLTDIAAAAGGPLTEEIGYRVSLHRTEQDGFRDNVFLGRDDTNGRDETSARLRLRWTPSDVTTVDATLWYADFDNGYDAFALDNGFTTFSDSPGRDAQRTRALSLRANHAVTPAVTVTSVTGYARSNIEFSFDADWGNQAYWENFFAPPDDAPFAADYDFFSRRDRVRETINQEIRLQSGEDGRWFSGTTEWIVGVYALHLRESLDTFDRGVFTDGSFAPSLDVRTSSSDYAATSVSGFGELNVSLSSRDTLSFGARLERREIDYSDSAGLDVSPDESAIGGHIRWLHTFDDTWSGYVGLSRGFRLGGFNLGEVPAGRREFDAEFLWNLEGGVRRSSETLSWGLSVFYAERDDQQVDTSFQLDPTDPSTFVFFVDNAASGRNFGLEFDARWQLNRNWSAFSTLGLLRAEFDDFVSPEVDLSGRDQAHAPRYTAAVGAEWRSDNGWFARGDVTAKDDFFFSNSHDQRARSQSIANAQVGYAAEQWQVTLWSRNLFDERYATRGFFFGNEPPDFAATEYRRLGDPRQYGLTFEWYYE
ncbi:MAG: TonB-dependent receptor [Pseudomonadota bacterium]